MSEKTPENPQDQEPFGADPQETQTPEVDPGTSSADVPGTGEREESISAEAIVNAQIGRAHV